MNYRMLEQTMPCGHSARHMNYGCRVCQKDVLTRIDSIRAEAFALKLMQTDQALIAAIDRIIALCDESR